ncbi:hypothetical protein [Candidatus Poriferisodalis sp.]|uniref:hypothetical protein n=1 Tax=Candidatus Poriferisodalis sp. TaxID=3101277 RepID=UPI003AF777E4
MTTNGVLTLVDEVAYQSWQQHIIYEKNRVRASDEQSSAGQANGSLAGGDSSDPPQEDSSDEQQYRSEVKARQLELVAAVAAGSAECSRYLLRQLRVTDEEALRSAVPSLPNPLTASELLRLPRYAEERIAESLSMSPAEAATPAFWAACHAVWIEQGNFDDLVAGFLEGPKADNAEARTRNFLRRTGGLERVRGKVSVLVNCPISTAWWRVRTAREIVAEAPSNSIDFETAHQLLHDPNIWPELTGLSVKRITSLNAPRARAAAIVALGQRGTIDNGVKASLRKIRCQGALRALGRLGHSYSLNTVPWEIILSTALEGIEEADIDKLSAESADLTEED